MDIDVLVDPGIVLRAHVARPQASSAGAARSRGGLLLVHGFPVGPKGASTSSFALLELADRLAADTGWVVLTPSLRGTGASGGEFSMSGWLADLRAALERLLQEDDVAGVWVAGFDVGGALAICLAAADQRVRGVAAFAAPSDFDEWASNPRRFADQARNVGVLATQHTPAQLEVWAQDLRQLRAIDEIASVPPRPILLVQGTDDEVVSMVDARALSDAADNQVELRMISGGGHQLRYDPRAVAILLGWLERQTVLPDLAGYGRPSA